MTSQAAGRQHLANLPLIAHVGVNDIHNKPLFRSGSWLLGDELLTRCSLTPPSPKGHLLISDPHTTQHNSTQSSCVDLCVQWVQTCCLLGFSGCRLTGSSCFCRRRLGVNNTDGWKSDPSEWKKKQAGRTAEPIRPIIPAHSWWSLSGGGHRLRGINTHTERMGCVH